MSEAESNPIQISVVIPTCHRNDLLALCLDRLAPGAQTLDGGRYEVIVSDDGRESTAGRLVRDRFPWAVWAAGPGRGPAANRNNGARLARGAWLAFTDDDCLPSSGWLAAYAEAVQTGARVYEGRTTCEAGVVSPLYEAPINDTGGNLWSCNLLIRASLFGEIGGFDEDFRMPSMEDTDLRERLRARREPIPFIARAVVDHPPRRKPSGRKLGEKYEANVQFWYKTGHRASFWPSFGRHVKHRLFLLSRFGPGRDMPAALGVLLAETAFVSARLPAWERKWGTFYAERPSVLTPARER